MGPLYLLATIHPDPARAAQVERILRRMVERTRLESGCELYDLVVAPDAPWTWFMVEKWSSRQAWEAHMASPHNVQGNAELQGLLLEPTELTFWEALPDGG